MLQCVLEQEMNTMDPVVINQIEFNPAQKRVYKTLRIKPDSRQEDLARPLLEEALRIARPKAMYRLVGIDQHLDNGVVLDGVQMDSKVMAVNLSEVHRVFFYINTSGRELFEWTQSKDDLLERYYAEEISQMALRTAGNYLLNHLKETFQLGKTASLNPGSLADWPITAQRSLFQIMGDPKQAIGVELLESMLMIPNQSVSGLRYSSETDFSNCELCPRGQCAHRRAPYDEALLKEKYQ